MTTLEMENQIDRYFKERYENKEWAKEAIFSKCLQYRYSLRRLWNSEKPIVLFVMLNPSTADAISDDPTIRRCINFANSWGYGGMIVVNLFAYRATNPKELLKVEDPIGPDNYSIIKSSIVKCDGKIIAAWGNAPILKKLGDKHKDNPIFNCVLDCIEQSKNGTPKHPLYLKKDLKPKPFITENLTGGVN